MSLTQLIKMHLLHQTNIHTISTPEGVSFSFYLACPVTRFMAWLIDLAAISVLSGFAVSLAEKIEIIHRDASIAISILLYFIISIGYGIVLEWRWRGQTVGKRILRLRVIDADGLRLQISQIIIRNLLRFIDSFPLLYLVGGASCLITRRSQRLGDISANTIVIRLPAITEPDLNQILPDKYNSLRNYPHLVSRLRQKVTPHETVLAIQSLLRRDEIEDRNRIQLFQEMASYFKTIVNFPQEATDGVSDEQYVRNVIDVITNSS